MVKHSRLDGILGSACRKTVSAFSVCYDGLERQQSESNGAKSLVGNSKRRRLLANIFITTFIIVYGSQTIPISFIRRGAPEAMRPTLSLLKDVMGEIDDVFHAMAPSTWYSPTQLVHV